MYLIHILHVFLFPITKSFITRLPNCTIYGNFSSKQDSYFESNSNKEIFYNISRNNCTIKCIGNSDCMFANHKMDDSICELLLVSREGTLVVKPGWRFLSTDYTKVMQKGPICESNVPCDWSLYCQDTCDHDGYVCYDSEKNIARESIATQSSTYQVHVAGWAIDGDVATGAATNGRPYDWWQLDLQQEYDIEVVSMLLYNFSPQILEGCLVSVLTSDNSLAFTTAIGKTHEYSFYCHVRGRYVKIGDGGCLNRNYYWIYEVKVFEV